VSLLSILRSIPAGAKLRSRQVQVTLINLASLAAKASVPFLVKYMVDQVSAGSRLFEGLVIGIVVAVIVDSIFEYATTYVWHLLRYEGIQLFRSTMFRSFLHKPLSFFTSGSTGDLMARVLDDVQVPAQQATTGIPMIVNNCVHLLIVASVLFVLQPRLAVVAVLSAPAYFVAFAAFNKRLRRASEKERREYGRISTDLQEIISGIRVIQVFRREGYVSDKFGERLNQYLRVARELLHFNALARATTHFISNMVPAVILVYGISLVSDGYTTIGSLIAFYSYIGQLYGPIQNLSDYNIGYQKATGSLPRILELITPGRDREPGTKITSIDSIELSGVSLVYQAGRAPALKDISLRIAKGEKVGIAGLSGGGKTSLLNVMLGLYEPSSGSVKVNGVDLRSVDLTSFYDRVGFVDQHNFMFSGTIEETIRMGRRSEKAIHEVAEVAQVSRFIADLPQGYETEVAELGATLSGGQKQRLCVARALLSDPELLVLDEATSALDNETETQLITSLDTYLQNNRTLIAVSHRPRILEACDYVVFVSGGSTTAMGHYRELLSTQEEFRQLLQTEGEQQA
jgi:ABC-type bacteriocin/lantibiotic exporter with double-glycine peptidase domain